MILSLKDEDDHSGQICVVSRNTSHIHIMEASICDKTLGEFVNKNTRLDGGYVSLI